MNNTGLWDKCLEAFCDSLSEKQMKTWIRPLEVSCNNDTLSVVAPNKFIKDTVESDFIELIKEMVLDILSQKNISRLNFINYDYLKKVVLEPHLKNKQNNHKKIWNIFVLVNWLNNNVY